MVVIARFICDCADVSSSVRSGSDERPRFMSTYTVFYSDGTLTLAESEETEITLPTGWYYGSGMDWSGPFSSKCDATVEMNNYVKFLCAEPRALADDT